MVEYPTGDRSVGALDATYAALSHPVRRQILSRLRRGDARVTDLAQPYEISLNAISKHLKALEGAGLVRRTIRGRDHWLGLEAEPLEAASRDLDAYRPFWEARLDSLEVLLAARRRRPGAEQGERP
jgi:DNA-binding transcriptional ArsR family regulator